MKKTPGLVRRNGTYYARKRVPKLLVDSLGKREIKISLETKNFDEARAKLPAALLEIQKQMAAAKQTADDVLPLVEQLSRGVLEQIARGWFKPRWDATTESLWQPPPPGVAVEDELCNLDPILTSLMRPDEVTFGEYLYRARQLLATAGHPNASGASIEMLARYMIRGEVECLKASRRFIVDGQLFNVIEDPLYRPVGGSAEGVASFDASKAQNGITVDQAIEQFTNDSQRANLSRKNIKGYEPGFKLLREVAGGGRPLSAVTREHARRVLDVLAHLPANATKRFSGMTLLEAAEHAKRNGVPPISAKTAENILYNFSSFFRWAVREHIIERFRGLRHCLILGASLVRVVIPNLARPKRQKRAERRETGCEYGYRVRPDVDFVRPVRRQGKRKQCRHLVFHIVFEVQDSNRLDCQLGGATNPHYRPKARLSLSPGVLERRPLPGANGR